MDVPAKFRTCNPPPKIVHAIIVAARCKAWTIFARSNTGVVGSMPFEAWMFVCVYSVFVLFCVGSGFEEGWSTRSESPIDSLYDYEIVKQRAKLLVDRRAHRGALIPQIEVRSIIASAKWFGICGSRTLATNPYDVIILPLNSMEQSPWESDSCFITHEIPRPSRSLQCSQQPATVPYREPDESSPHPPIQFLKMHFNIIALTTSTETAVNTRVSSFSPGEL
jgi:hypothetical protein